MEQKNKNALIGGLLAVVFVMAVGYAAFATQLNINGTANITSTWDVHIQEIKVADEGQVGTGASTSQAVEEGDLTATFVSTLTSPGDSVTYDVTVVNAGTLPAKLSEITFAQTNNGEGTTEDTGDLVEENTGSNYEGENAIVYSYSGLEKDSVLESGGKTITFKVKVEYNPKVTGQPDKTQLQSKLKMALTYIQNTEG